MADEAGADVTGDVVGVSDEPSEEGDVGFYAFDVEFVEGDLEPSDGDFAGLAFDDEFGDHGVVVGGDGESGVGVGVDADASEPRGVPSVDFAGTGGEVLVGVLGGDAGFDGVSLELDVVLGEGEGFTGGDADLPLDDVESGDFFRNGVFDLDSGVHFEEVELSGGVEEELDGSGVGVSDVSGNADGGFSHGLAGGLGEDGAGGFFDDFLVAQVLDAAFALAEVEGAAMFVGEDLDFDVAGFDEAFFDDHLA